MSFPDDLIFIFQKLNNSFKDRELEVEIRIETGEQVGKSVVTLTKVCEFPFSAFLLGFLALGSLAESHLDGSEVTRHFGFDLLSVNVNATYCYCIGVRFFF